MRNKFKFLVIVAIVALTGMMLFSSCSDSMDQTVIRVTDLGAHNGKIGAILVISGTDMWYGGGTISGGILDAPLYNWDTDKAVELNGGYADEIYLRIDDADGYDYDLTDTTHLPGGTVTLSFNDFTWVD